MRIHALLLFFFIFALSTTRCAAQDENTEDVFDRPLQKEDVEMPKEEFMNEGSDSFVTSTEMLEMSANDTSLEVNPIQKTSVFSPITPLEGAVFNFSQATIEEDSMEDVDDSSEKTTFKTTTTTVPTSTVTLDVITFSSLPIEVDEVADRRVLKEKELPTPTKPVTTTTQSTSAVSDPSETDDEGETPFDQSALEGLFEQDGSVIDSSLTTDPAPAFPILKMKEEDSKILSNPREYSTEATTTTQQTTPSSTTTTTTEAATTTTETVEIPTTELAEPTTSEEATTSSEETTTEDIAATPALKNSSKVFLPAKAIRTPITFRIVSLEFSPDFNDIHSGPSKKLSKELVPAVGEFINSIAGADNLVTVEIKSFRKGSVVVGADLLTKKSLGDAQMAVNLLEAAFSRNNSMVSDYKIDSLSVTVDGMTSQAYIDSISTQTASYSLSSLMIVIITFALVIIFAVALFIIMITTKRRRQSTMKLSLEDTIRSITPDSNDTPHNVHLMSYGTTPRASQKAGPITKTQIDETSPSMY
ncbi:unnamed protein product [Caenorhabditis sp. 36 PRJEB53466]|nr:unnamed protein product [Caenorhabditis sp. 36 PRJEB53466]